MVPKPTKDFFSADEAAHLSGLTRAMLVYLCRTALAVPSLVQKRGKGRRRRYSFGDVVLLRSINRMLKAGISVLGFKRALQSLRKHHPEITPNSLPATHLVTDGQKIYFRHGNDAVEEVVNGQFAFAFVLGLAKIKREVLDQIDVVPAPTGAGGFHYRVRSS